MFMSKLINVLVVCSILMMLSACSTEGKNGSENKSTGYTTKAVEVKGADGMLPVIVQTPNLKDGEKCPVAIIMHGFMANKEYPLIANIADKLVAKGFATVRFDFNGHGESYGNFQDMTVLSELEDAKGIIKYVQTLPYTTNINLVVHSQGGVVTSLAAGELESAVNSIVLFAPAAVLKDELSGGTVLGIPFDTENVPEYIEVFNHKVGRNYILEGRDLMIYERASAYTGPACIIQGVADRVVPYAYAEKYHKIYEGSELNLLEGENHGFENDPDKAVKIAVNFLKKVNF